MFAAIPIGACVPLKRKQKWKWSKTPEERMERRRRAAREYYYRNKAKFRRYREENKEKIAAYHKDRGPSRYARMSPEQRERKNELRRIWRARNPQEKEQSKDRYLKNKAAGRLWHLTNPEACRKYSRESKRKRFATDLNFRFRQQLAGRVRTALKRVSGLKSKKTMELIGCTLPELKRHLETQFLPGMTWENWGRISSKKKHWNVDHIKACCHFDLTDPAQQAVCFHYSNMQPLWAVDNLIKGICEKAALRA